VRLKTTTSLISTLINAHYGLSKRQYQYFEKKERIWEPILFTGVIITLLITLGPIFVNLQQGMIEEYRKIGLEALFLNNSIMITGMLGFFLGLFFVVNEFFYTRNLSVLVPLPLKPKEVLAGKLTVILLDQIWISLVIFLPSALIYGVKLNVNPVYWIVVFVIFVFAQFFPVLLQTIFILPVSRFFNFGKHRDFMVFFFSILLLVGILGFQFWISNDLMSGDVSAERMTEIMSDPDNMINKIGKAYPPAFLGVKALTTTGFAQFSWLLGFIGFHLICFWIALLIGEKMYYESFLKFQDHAGRTNKFTTKQIYSAIGKRRSPFQALLSREWRYFLRVPSFSFNGFGNVVIFPVLIVIFYFAKNNSEFQVLFEKLMALNRYNLPIGALLGTLVGGMNMLSSTAFSREGKLLGELESLPISSTALFKVKLIHVSMISFIGPLSASLAFFLLFKATFIECILMLLISILLVLFLNLVQILLDASFPTLNWENPQKAMKQNINGLYTILIVFGFVGAIAFLGFLLRDVLSAGAMSIILFLIGLSGCLAFYSLSKGAVSRLMERDYTG